MAKLKDLLNEVLEESSHSNKYQVIEKFFTKQEAIDFLNQIFLQNKERV